MARTKISEFSATPGNNTDIDGINIAEGCAPSGINDAIRELMAQLKDFQAGTAGDSFNGPVGTTTAAAGAFTTLSASSTVTLSGGTANGVPYLNGSKVLTTGSALTFDGSNLSTVQSDGYNGLRITNTTGKIRMSGYVNGTIGAYMDALNAAESAYTMLTTNGNPLVYSINGSERMRLTSTGLGIGTSSPAAKLDVVNGQAYISATSSQYALGLRYNSSTNGTLLGSPAANTFTISTWGGTEQLRLDSSGNLGLGVTPSAWSTSASIKAIQLPGVSLWGYNSLSAFLNANSYNDGSNYIYVNNGFATEYGQAGGEHSWSIAASGNAGDPITFTQAMTLNASGNLGIGTTSPANRLSVNGNANITGNTTLGDASTDTVTVNGYMGVGGAANSVVSAYIRGTHSGSATDLYAARVTQTIPATTTGSWYAFSNVNSTTAASAFTAQSVQAFYATNTAAGAGSTITNQHGLRIEDLTSATNNYGITSQVSSGANKWNIYASGTAANYFAGNIGLGVTPSAWGGGFKAFELVGGSVFSGASTNLGIMQNAYYDGANYLYKTTATAARYFQVSGQHIFYTAPSGTAGNAISFTQAMTLDASGNLGVGTTSPQATIVAAGSNATVYKAMILRNGNGTDGSSATIDFETSSGTQGSEAAMAGRIAGLRTGSGTSGALTFSTTNGGTLGERARITSGGEVYIAGTTDQGAYNLQVNGTGVWGAGAYVNGSDRNLKNNIQSLDSCLDVVMAMRPVTFQYKPEHSKDQSVQPGFIAQELQEAMAGKAYIDGVVQSGPEYLNVAYQNIIPILTKAIQELNAKVEAQAAEIAALKSK